MRNIITQLMLRIGLIGALTLPALVAPAVAAAPIDVFKPCSTTSTTSSASFCQNQKNQKLFGPGSLWTNIINTIIFLVGAVAVIMIIVGGLRYVLSGGDSGSVNNAKNTILYAVVGLVVTIMSYAIVNFVLSKI